MAKRGHPRDGKRRKVQVNYGPATGDEGLPVTADVHEGSLTNSPTVLEQVQKPREKRCVDPVILVATAAWPQRLRSRSHVRRHGCEVGNGSVLDLAFDAVALAKEDPRR